MDNTDLSSANLSEILFKPKYDYVETSVISNSGCALPDLGDGFHLMGSHFRALWYRPLNRFSWAYLGANCLDIDVALANIVMSDNERSRDQCYDTVKQYGPGNWIYEFCTIGQNRLNQARQSEERGDLAQASHQYRMASRYFAIAAYPNLKGDDLASQASLYGRRAYRKIFNDPVKYGHYAEQVFTVNGEKVTGYLHSANNKELQPCVVVVTSYGSTATDYYRFFSDYLRKEGIALFAVDMPGLGSASKVVLGADTSVVLAAAVEHLKKVEYIDSSALGAVGFHVSANAVARLAITHPNLFKAMVLVSPALHNAFVNQDLLNSMSLAARSSLANRLNLDASTWDTIIPQLQILSLRKQGLVSRNSRVPTKTLTMLMPIDLHYNNDQDLIDQVFSNNKTLAFTKMRVSEFAARIFNNAGKFFAENLKD